MPTLASPRVKSIQRRALALLVIGGVVNYIDRATLAIGNPMIRHDLGLSVVEMGLLLSAFLWAYAFSQLPTGALVDRLGPRRLLTAGLTLWSFAQLLGGVVGSYGQFICARVLLGVGEAPQFPTGARVARDWFAVRDRGVATGIFNCASTLGSAIAAPLLTGLMLAFGWRWMFIIMGLAGLTVALVWYGVYRDPTELSLTPEENRYRVEGDPDADARPHRVSFGEWRGLFGFRTTWGMIAGFFGNVYMTWIYGAWLPGYLEMERHMSVSRTGLLAAIPFAFGVVGGLSGGWLADWLVARGWSPIASRKWPMAISTLGMAGFTLLTAVVPSSGLAIACVSAAMFLGYVASTAAWATASVAAPANCTASLGAMQNFGGYLGGALAPTLTGLLVQATGSFNPALYFGAGVGAVGALLYIALVQEPITEAALLARGVAPAAA